MHNTDVESCAWLEWFKISTRVAHACQSIPFYLRYDWHREEYVIYTSGIRKTIWVLLQISSTVIFAISVRQAVTEIRASHDISVYFELIIILGFFAFDFPFKYKWCFCIGKVEEFFEELQTSQLMTIATTRPTQQRQWYTAFNLYYVSTYFMYFLVRWGIFYWSLDGYYTTIKITCDSFFGVPETWEGRGYYVPILLISFVLFGHQIVFLICGDLLSVSSILTMNHIAHDLDRAIQSAQLSDMRVLQLIQAQKVLTGKFNEAFGLLVCTYVTYCSPFYSLHFVDMFSTPGTMNLVFTFTYVGVLGVALKLAIDIAIMARRRKRWLNERCSSMDKGTVTLFLDDISSGKFTMGSFFRVNAYVTGQIVSLLITVAVVRLQTRA